MQDFAYQFANQQNRKFREPWDTPPWNLGNLGGSVTTNAGINDLSCYTVSAMPSTSYSASTLIR